MTRRTCLYDEHVAAGATMVDFHGWEMPIRYEGIPQEHAAVRTRAGIFDLCHMGRLDFVGPDAERRVQFVVSSDIGPTLETRGAKYGLLCDDDGGVIDDVITYKLPDRVFVVVNASNREADIEWFEAHRGALDAELRDRTFELGMVALQGPDALDLAAPMIDCGRPLAELPYFRIAEGRLDLGGTTVDGLVAATGYTGERGVEIYLPADDTPVLWRRAVELGFRPIGLGARDTLRIEAAMPLYGQELTREINPYEVGLGFAVALGKGDFPGRAALERIREAGASRKLVGLRLETRKIARTGMPVFQGEREIGVVTSGIPSPTLGESIALALVAADVDNPGDIAIEIRGKRFTAAPEALPFVSRTRKKGKRAL